MKGAGAPILTVVLPVRNEEGHIGNTLHQVFAQEFPQRELEVLVVDGDSDDRTVEEARRAVPADFADFRLIGNPGRRSSAGRNIGFREGRGEYFIVIDGHCYLDNSSLFKNVVRLFEETGADCLCRPQLLSPPGLSDFQKAVAYARATRLGHGVDSTIYGAPDGYVSPQSSGAMYRRDVFTKVGYVDESFDACEDVEFNYRVEKAGLKSYYSKDLLVYYYPRGSLGSLFRQMARYGSGRVALLRKHPDTFRWHLFVPLAFFLMALATPALLIGGFTRSVTAAMWALYLLALLPSIVKANDVSVAIRLLPVYLGIHAGLGYGQLVGILQWASARARPAERSDRRFQGGI